MKRIELPAPLIGMIAGTRLALGLGLGFLLADRLNPERRRTMGWVLFSLGAATTVPLIGTVLGLSRHAGN